MNERLTIYNSCITRPPSSSPLTTDRDTAAAETEEPVEISACTPGTWSPFCRNSPFTVDWWWTDNFFFYHTIFTRLWLLNQHTPGRHNNRIFKARFLRRVTCARVGLASQYHRGLWGLVIICVPTAKFLGIRSRIVFYGFYIDNFFILSNSLKYILYYIITIFNTYQSVDHIVVLFEWKSGFVWKKTGLSLRGIQQTGNSNS